MEKYLWNPTTTLSGSRGYDLHGPDISHHGTPALHRVGDEWQAKAAVYTTAEWQDVIFVEGHGKTPKAAMASFEARFRELQPRLAVAGEALEFLTVTEKTVPKLDYEAYRAAGTLEALAGYVGLDEPKPLHKRGLMLAALIAFDRGMRAMGAEVDPRGISPACYIMFTRYGVWRASMTGRAFSDGTAFIATSFRGEQQERPWFAGRPSQKWNHYPNMRPGMLDIEQFFLDCERCRIVSLEGEELAAARAAYDAENAAYDATFARFLTTLPTAQAA